MQHSSNSSESSNNQPERAGVSTEQTSDLGKLFKSKKTSKDPSRKPRLFRKKSEVSEENDTNNPTEEELEVEIKRDELQGLLELRKLTTRKQRGLDADQLGKGDLKQLTSVIVNEAKEIEETPKSKKGMMESFTKQTNVMDVDKHMMNYIESQIEKLKNSTSSLAELPDGDASDETLPEHLRLKNIRGNEGDVILSSAMLTAIPEVDLGIETQLKNIEETEIAKQALLEKSLSQDNTIEEVLPVNPYCSLANVNTNSNLSHKGSQRPITDEEAVARFRKRLRK